MSSNTTLLAITGLSPQVITESLFGILDAGLEWPQQIKIITTKLGSQKAYEGLIQQRQLEKLCHEYEVPMPSFSLEDILIVPNAQGEPVDDARSLDDQEALADFIMKTVAELTKDETSILHASISGGRKTMTFFLGYAMTVFGRQHDRLSHVLVSAEFESLADFYYPTRESRNIKSRAGELLDAKDAAVTLAEIPFVSQRELLDTSLLQEFKDFGYSGLVQQIQLTRNPREIALTFEFDTVAPRVFINDRPIDFVRNKLEFAFFAMCARPRNFETEDGVERPTDDIAQAIVTKYFLQELVTIAGIEYQARDEIGLLEQLQDLDILRESSTQSLINDGQVSVSTSFFDTRKVVLKRHLLKHCPKSVVDLIMPTITHDKDQAPLKRGTKSAQRGFYGCWLTADQVCFKTRR